MTFGEKVLILLNALLNPLENPTFVTTVALLIVFVVWMFRVRRLMWQRRRIRGIYGLSEEVLGAGSAAEIQQRLERSLPEMLGLRAVRIWIESRVGRVLEPASERQSPGGMLSREEPPPGAQRAFEARVAVLQAAPRRRIFLPMQANARTTGVLELELSRNAWRMHVDEEAALQHLANQAAIGMQLLDQRLLREHVLRGERVGAVGQLISGIARELQGPMRKIAGAVKRMRESGAGAADELSGIEQQAVSASETLERLLSLGRSEQARPRPVDLNDLVRGLTEFRAPSWSLQLVEASVSLAGDELLVLASPGQLEQALLSLLVLAEHSMSADAPKRITLCTRQGNGWGLIEIFYPAAPESGRLEGAQSAEVAQGLLENQGGTLRMSQADGQARLLVELPLTQLRQPLRRDPAPRRAARAMTILLLESDLPARRRLLEALASRQQRVVPVASAGEAADLAGRMRFDACFSTSEPPDTGWMELQERLRPLVPVFVLMPRALAPGPRALGQAGDALLLPKPVEDSELDEALQAIEGRIVFEDGH